MLVRTILTAGEDNFDGGDVVEKYIDQVSDMDGDAEELAAAREKAQALANPDKHHHQQQRRSSGNWGGCSAARYERK